MKPGRVGFAFAVAGLLLTTGSATALAQDEKPVVVTVDLGFVNTAGNTDVTTLNAGDKLVYTSAPYVFTQTFNVVYGRTDSVTTASQWRAGGRLDYQLAPRISLYGQARYERNTFAGIARRFEESVGVAALLLESAGGKLTAEAGASLNQQKSTADVTSNFTAGRVAVEYRRSLTETAYFTLGTEFLPNFETSEDYRINGLAALVAPISKSIALKASYEVRYDHLPEPGFQKSDRILTTGLQIVF
jgi:putative salt-induced outer membrane protein